MKWSLVALVLIVFSAVANAGDTVVRVTVTGIKGRAGKIRCMLYEKERGFPDKPKLAARRVEAPIAKNRAVCIFKGVRAGRYAVSAFHDQDNDKRLDTNFLGIPSEGIAVSNNAKGRFGPPKFRDALFSVTSKGFSQFVKLKY